MRIAFWSEQKESGTTFNLAVTACAAICLHPLSVAVVSGGYHDGNLERKFFGKKQNTIAEYRREAMLVAEHRREAIPAAEHGQVAILASDTQKYLVTSGLECLLRKERPEELTETVVKANMRQVVKDRMFCLPTSDRQEYEWWHQDCQFKRMRRVMAAVESYFDVVFIDCGSRQDDYAKKVFREADVCVLNMTQEAEVIGKFYRNPPDYKGKVFFLLGKYFEDALYNRQDLQRIYRIEEERLGAIPYNSQLHAAEQMGRIKHGVKHYLGRNGEGQGMGFEKELVRTTNLILRLAGLVS